MSMKSLMVNIDPEKLKNDPALETQFLKLHGREALNRVYSEEEGYDFTEEQVAAMSDQEFGDKKDEILEALAAGRVK